MKIEVYREVGMKDASDAYHLKDYPLEFLGADASYLYTFYKK